MIKNIDSKIFFLGFIFSNFVYTMDPIHKYERWCLESITTEKPNKEVSDYLKITLANPSVGEAENVDPGYPKIIRFNFCYPYQIKNNAIASKEIIRVGFRVAYDVPYEEMISSDSKFLYFRLMNQNFDKEVILEVNNSKNLAINLDLKTTLYGNPGIDGDPAIKKNSSIAPYMLGGFVAAISVLIILYKMEYLSGNMLPWFSK